LYTIPGSQASISSWIAKHQVVYVSWQVFYKGYGWYMSNYNGLSGYIRQEQLRAMTLQEVSAYLSQQTLPSPMPRQTAAPYDPYARSNYGYVTSDSVDFRQTPGGTRIGVLNQYAFALVLGSHTSSSTLWYNINQGGTIGWVSGNFFKVMNITEYFFFLNSSDFVQGIINSGSSSTTTGLPANTACTPRRTFRRGIGLWVGYTKSDRKNRVMIE
jgi:hypothetical protein